MRLADAAASIPNHDRGGRACTVVRVRTIISETPDIEDGDYFETLLDEVKRGLRTAASVARILSAVGIKVSGDNLTYHLRGDCGCPR